MIKTGEKKRMGSGERHREREEEQYSAGWGGGHGSWGIEPDFIRIAHNLDQVRMIRKKIERQNEN